MSFFSGLLENFDFWMLVNIFSILVSLFICIRSVMMWQENKRTETLQQLKDNARRRRDYRQSSQSQQQPMNIVLPEAARDRPKEEFLNGNDLRVVSKNLYKTTAERVSENIGEA